MNSSNKYRETGKIFNSLSKSLWNWPRPNDRPLNWYVCGPTVYDEAHIGHARTYVCFDMMRRTFSGFGLDTTVLMGITDVDDKILSRAQRQKVPVSEIAGNFEQRFVEDLAKLGVQLPDRFCRVSDSIGAIVSFVEQLIRDNYAYVTGRGDVFFSISNYKSKGFEYPKFRGFLGQEENFFEGKLEKREPHDFALWKAKKLSDETSWRSPWGLGRPGWHIECSAIIHSIFGRDIDLHSGGTDLQFPHHENEIAQSEALYGESPWCPIFNHTGHLHTMGTKMSKSLGNFVTIRDLLRDYSADEFRMMCMRTDYKRTLEFNPQRLEECKFELRKIKNCFKMAVEAQILSSKRLCDVFTERDLSFDHDLAESKSTITNCLLDDFNFGSAYNILSRVLFVDFMKYLQSEPHPLICKRLLFVSQGFFGLMGFQFQQLHEWSASYPQNKFPSQASEFRSKVRSAALSIRENNPEASKSLLDYCDDFRVSLENSGHIISDKYSNLCPPYAKTISFRGLV